VQIANYNLKDKQQGAWHHDESADISVVIPLNTGDYKGGGTEFHNHGVLSPLPSGHALIFPSFTNLHRGLPVEEGDRYLLVFWLYDRKRAIHLYEEVVE
jgi:predicted 2-oxoglutarate/Fe(II)-dependent dioxygenase YbiX